MGLILNWAKKTTYETIDTRAQTLAVKPFRSRISDASIYAFAETWDHWKGGNKTLVTCTTRTNRLVIPSARLLLVP